ncbi:PAS domain-containing sensor histidine kinase, partial [Myxococcota bacterium]|nr:PAS domain-containing sensor histidine kinase [Myxococcota bacterium]
VEDLLSLSRMEAGEKAGFAMNEQKVLSLVRQSVTLLEERVQARNVTISLSIEETLTFVGNAPLLIQAFTNLLDNAIKYGRENSTVTVVGELTPDHVVLSFSDEGEGIEPIHLERLFERFYRVDKGRSKALGGTGLGLAIVKHIVKLHGGTVTVSSTPGKGSAFRVSLPRQN